MNIAEWASQLSTNFSTIATLLQVVAAAIGIVLLISAFFQFKKYGETRTMMSTQMSIAGPLTTLIAGTLLVMLPTFIGTAMMTFWGTTSPLGYQGGPTGYSALVPAILVFVRIIGVGAFIRGVVLLARAGKEHGQPGTLGKALIHMFAGLLCIHILGTKELLESILGLSR